MKTIKLKEDGVEVEYHLVPADDKVFYDKLKNRLNDMFRKEAKEEPQGKLISEWLKELPDGYRELALENYKNKPRHGYVKTVYSKNEALINAFIWNDTTEGYSFWNNVSDYLEVESRGLPSLPKPKLEVWKPKVGDEAYFLCMKGFPIKAGIEKWEAVYNYFQTKEQAIEAHEKALFNYEVEMFIKEKNEGWVPDFGFGLNLDEEELDCIYSLNEGYRGVFVDSEIEIRNKSYSKYFKTKEIGEEIISKFDNEKLIKWWI